MKRTIGKLRLRRDRYRSAPPLPRLWSFALVTINLILIAFLILDTPVGSYAPHTPYILRRIGRIVTEFGNSGWVLLASALLFFEAWAVTRLAPTCKARVQAMYVTHIAAFMLISVSLSGLAANVLKRAIGRARPGMFAEWGAFGFQPFAHNSRFESFPSGHATTVGAILMVLALLAPRYRVLFVISALWLGLSRVLVAMHYPSDVVAGLTFGAWCSLLVAIMFARHGLLFRQATDGWPVLRRPIPFGLRPNWTALPLPPRGVPPKPTTPVDVTPPAGLKPL
jgi:Membrane-associated phospholipid phosphatase